MTPPIVVSVAGSDPSGGAGIQADLKTFAAHQTYGAAVITALTAQNTTGVSDVLSVPGTFVAAQLRDVLDDLAVGAIKTGMLNSPEVVNAVVDTVADYPDISLVVDPVMVATSGDRLVSDGTLEVIIERLVPIATVLTPNLPEAAALLGLERIGPAGATSGHDATGDDHANSEDHADSDDHDMVTAMTDAGGALRALGAAAVVVKGGHGIGPEATDVLVDADGTTTLRGPRIDTANTHGTGCTFSSAIAAGLAHGATVGDSVGAAKAYLTGAIAAGVDHTVGHERGPVHHFYALWAGDDE